MKERNHPTRTADRIIARRAVDEVFGPPGPGPFPAGPGVTRGGRAMPVVHSEEAAIDREDELSHPRGEPGGIPGDD